MSRSSWFVLGVAWIVSAGLIAAWLTGTPPHTLREQLKALQFWSLELCVAIGVAVGVVLVRGLRGEVTRTDVRWMALLASVAVLLTVFVAPRTNRIYYDEQIYQSIGQNLSDLKLAQTCNEGNVDYGWLQCSSGEYNKQPYAYPHLLSLGYRAFGVHASTAFMINAIVMALTVVSVYLLVLVMFADHHGALFAGLLMALTPQHIIWSATAAVEPSAALACVGAVLAAACFARSRRPVSLAAAVVASAYAVQFRPESLLILPVVGVVLWPTRAEWRRPRTWWIALLAVALVAVHIGHMFAVRNEGWGTTDARLSLRYVADNLAVNGGFYLGDRRYPLAFTLLALAGLTRPTARLERWSVAAWFALFFGIFLLFYAGSYNYGADVRYSLMTSAPLAVLGGLGAARVAEWWRQRASPGIPATAVLIAALVFQFSWYAPLVRATTEEAWAARADVAFARSLVPELSENSYVLAHNPGMFHLWGVNAGQMARVVIDPGYLPAIAGRYSGGIYLHWNFWCNVQDLVQQEFCQKALASGTFEPVREHRERDHRFALYRFVAPSDRR